MDHPTEERSRPSSGQRIGRAAALLVALVSLPALVACGGESSGDGEGSTDAATGMSAGTTQAGGAMQQYQQLSQQLSSIRQQALQDSALQAEQAALMERIRSAMEEDPQTEALLARFDSASQAFQQAQSSGDTAAMQQLMPRLQQMQMQLQQAQGQVAQDSAIAVRIDSFTAHLEAKMEEINPRAPQMMDRVDSLAQQVRQEMSAAAESAAGAGTADTGSRQD